MFSSDRRSLEETEALVAGVEALGCGRWKEIKAQYSVAMDRRSPIDLKDKWRNLVRICGSGMR